MKKYVENVCTYQVEQEMNWKYVWNGGEEAMELFTVINNRESSICRWRKMLSKMKKNRKVFTRCSVGKQINGFTQAFRLILHELKFKSSAWNSMISWKHCRCWSVYRLRNQLRMNTWIIHVRWNYDLMRKQRFPIKLANGNLLKLDLTSKAKSFLVFNTLVAMWNLWNVVI